MSEVVGDTEETILETKRLEGSLLYIMDILNGINNPISIKV